MKLGIKLPLTFAISLALLFAGGLFGIYRLNGAVSTYETDVLHHVAAHKKAAEISAHFSVAIQEWKNLLLRGKDEKEMQKYWDAHEKAMQNVQKLLNELVGMKLDGEEKVAVDKVVAGMAQARDGYKKALEDFKASGNDHIAGDKAARGKDREAATRLAELRELFSKAETQAADAAEASAGSATWAALSVMTLVMLVALVVSVYLSRRIVAHLQAAVTVAERVAHGDLTNQVDASGQDEIAALLRALDEMQGQLIKLVTSVRNGAEGVAEASSEIAHGNHDLSMRTEQQASAVQETASSMTQLGTAVSHSSDNARQASQLAANASSVAVRGGDVVNQVVSTMKDIDDSSHKISEIIGVIDGIAFQTNILALNAAVEAARAGEQGRGFAVVASEVRALAGRSADAAKEIKGLINASVERVEHGTALVAQAGETMQEVVNAIQRVTDIVSEISAAAAEQNSGVTKVGEAVHHIDETTQQNAALVEEMAAAASGLKSQSEELVRLVSTFKLNSGDSVAKAAVRASTPQPFKGEERRTMPAAPAPSAPRAVTPAKPALRPAAPKPAAKPEPKPVAAAPVAPAAPKKAAADEEWETF